MPWERHEGKTHGANRCAKVLRKLLAVPDDISLTKQKAGLVGLLHTFALILLNKKVTAERHLGHDVWSLRGHISAEYLANDFLFEYV